MDDWVERWWMGFGLALFLLLPVDLVLTLFAVAEHGVEVEMNPLMRWLIDQGMVAVVVVHLIVVGLAVVLFDTLIEVVRYTPVPYRTTFIHGVSIWIGLVFTAGLALTANHLLRFV